MSIYDRIAAGEFKLTKSCPARPVAPPLLSKRAGALSPQDYRDLPAIRESYMEALKEWEKACAAVRAEGRELDDKFRAALNEEYGLLPEDPFVERMHAIAWENGHSNGYSEVVAAFSDLLPLWEIYRDKKGG